VMKSQLQVKTVRGTPIRAYGRTLTPVARVVSAVRHRATIRAKSYDAVGWGAAWVEPLAVVEQDGSRVRTVLIPNVTATVLRQMAAVALALPALCLAAISIARRIRKQ
jgi:uncharacterized spore protein YtfJ